MAQAKLGDKVKVHYTGTLEDGTTFDSSQDREPLEFTLGSQQVIPGFEQGVVGMEVGGTKSVSIPPDDAYGLRRDDLTLSVKKDQFPDTIKPEVGQQLQMTQPDGQPVMVTVTDIEDDDVKLDANHPLAGKTLNFKIELVEII